MNLRQKAKRFKKLYEESLPKKPYPVIYKSERGLKHYKQSTSFISIANEDYTEYAPDLVNHYAVTELLDGIRPIITKNIKEERDRYTGNIIYSVDIWI